MIPFTKKISRFDDLDHKDGLDPETSHGDSWHLNN
jgi:hypothetical protein